MVKVDYYALNGYPLELLAQSTYHKQYPLGAYFRTEILPPLWANQFRFYLTDDGVPTAKITWAWLSAEIEADLHATGRSLAQDEWTCGDRLFFNDWITPYDNMREVAHDIGHNIFPDNIATSLRRNHDGSVRRINRWIGANVRKSQPALREHKNGSPKKATPLGQPFKRLQDFPALTALRDNWGVIRDEAEALDLQTLAIQRDDKSHDEVFAEVQSHMQSGGSYGWLKGWGAQANQWTQLGLVFEDQTVPFMQSAMPRSLKLLKAVRGIKVAALLKMAPGTFLDTHQHPEIAEQGLLQFHLTMKAAEDCNFAYVNVDGTFRQHTPGAAFVFDGSRPHFAVNASQSERVILYLEFDAAILRDGKAPGEDADDGAAALEKEREYQ